MALRIKVTGYLPVDDIEQRHLDLQHETGLSSEGYDYWSDLLRLEDVEFELKY
jgi:hypothetical protein